MSDNNDENRPEDAELENWDTEDMFEEEEFPDSDQDQEYAGEEADGDYDSGEEYVEEENSSDEEDWEGEQQADSEPEADDAADDTAVGTGKRGKKKKKKDGDAPSLLSRIAESSPYEVMLWIAVLVLLAGIFLMLGEFMSYDGMTKPIL